MEDGCQGEQRWASTGRLVLVKPESWRARIGKTVSKGSFFFESRKWNNRCCVEYQKGSVDCGLAPNSCG